MVPGSSKISVDWKGSVIREGAVGGMAEQGEASTTAERFRSGKEDREGSKLGHGASDVAAKKPEVDQRAGDPSSSHREPFFPDGIDRGKASVPGMGPAQEGPFRGFLPVPAMENWPFNPSAAGAGFDLNALGPLVPVLLPGPYPAFCPMPGQEQQPAPGGIFAVPVMPMFGAMGTIPQSGFVPLSFNLPPVVPPGSADAQTQAGATPAARPGEAGRAAPQAEGRDGAAPNGLRQRNVAAVGARPRQGGARPGDPQRQPQVVRRFQVGFQLDLLLILKLAVVVIVFNQDGSKNRLILLLLLAGVVYLYQTGALAPVLQWISLSAQRAMMPPQQHVPVAEGPQNVEGAGVPPPNVGDAPAGPEGREGTPPAAPVPNSAAVGQGEVPPEEQRAEQPPHNVNWWGIFKELQMIVVGFLTSLLPGFQHVE